MTAIYQKARPVTFTQVIGQDHVKAPLMAALRKNRIGHAYLFSGPRGVGKTTTARLLAMAVNCEAQDKPCGVCASCQLVREGAHPDVTELDAASNNSVEDIRDLREKVRLSPIRGGRRVWILDEAHMLSKSAANALLKTLEEPPEGLVFILATTEPEKLPPTILSRTQHFRFRRLSEAEIASKLTQLTQEAGVAAEPEALALVAKAADGAMRDAESLLERLLASSEAITFKATESALGLPPQTRLQALAAALAANDLKTLLEGAGALYRDGFAPRTLAERLGLELRAALHHKLGIGEGVALELPQATLVQVIAALDDEMERFVRYDDLYSLEMTLIKAANVASGNLPQAVTERVAEAAVPAPSTPSPKDEALPDFDPTGRGRTARAPKQQPSHQQAPKTPVPSSAPEAPGSAAPDIHWRTVLGKTGVQLRAFLNDARATIAGEDVQLDFAHDFHYKRALERHEELAKALHALGHEGALVTYQSPGGEQTKKG